MKRSTVLLAFLASTIFLPSSVLADEKRPSVDDFFSSMRTAVKGNEQPDNTKLYAFLIAMAAFILCLVAVKHWSRQRDRPAPLKNQKKLLGEAARQAGISRAQMKSLMPLAEAEGISSPLVAIVCPSVLKKLAGRATSDKQRNAIAALAKEMSKA